MFFKSSDEVFEWLSSFINLERGQTPKSFKLERMEILATLADHPEKCVPSIHVAGSKGKGSVTGMLAAILTAAGYRVGRYMSPHVVDIRERLCLGDSYFDEDVYLSAGNELHTVIEERLVTLANTNSAAAALFNPASPEGCEPTFWELLTLLFFLCVRKAKCDVMVVETGMGGRLDSTNVLDPLVSVITLIELEHTAILGKTITAIAGEKAGIIKTNKPLVLAKQRDEALAVFQEKTQEKNSQMFYFPKIAELTNINITPHGTEFTLTQKDSSFLSDTAFSKFSIPLPGKVQAENAALAIAAVKIAFPQTSEEVIRKGLANLKIPGRFEKIMEQPPFIIDGAHTPESLALCVETFCSLYGEGGILLFSCASDKDYAAMAKIAHSHFSKIIITTPGTFKTSYPEKIYETFVEIAGNEKTVLVLDTQESVRQAMKFAKASHADTGVQAELQGEGCENYLPLLGTGSFYLIAEIRKCLL
ncbi:MAG: Mur ligase family protein [Treponema sp.]|nr:Mur ligase family protein [Treponema sp.]